MAEEKYKDIPTGLYWKNKKKDVDRVVLPFQTIETINESRATREREKKTGKDIFYENSKGSDWYNHLIWGDNKYVMASLMEEYAGKIDLIYIDPPFFTGTDQDIILKVGDEKQPLEKQPSLIEEAAYRNIWRYGNDSYFQWIYDRLVLMHSLLSSKGSIFIRHDQHWSHYIKVIADEVFGKSKFANEIIVSRIRKNVTQQGKISIPIATDSLFLYMIGSDAKFYNIYKKLDEKREGHWRAMDSAGIRPNPQRVVEDKVFYPPPGRHFTFTQERVDQFYQQGKVRINPTTNKLQYWVEETDVKILDSNWTDISGYSFTTGYPTENSEKLLERVIKACSEENDLVADFFCGSGTTGAVAEKIGRKWIMADIGRYAIHTTRKRLLGIDSCKPFVVQNLGKYERQYWHGVTFKKMKDEQIPIYEYIQFILKLYNAEQITGMLHVHGKRGKRMIHVGAIDAPVTLSEIIDAIGEVSKAGQKSLDVLGWEWEMGLHDVIEKEAKTTGINLRLFNIPRDVMDPRAVEKGDIVFYELAYLEVETVKNKNGLYFIKLKDFAIPNLDLIPPDVREKIQKWADYIDYWAVDWDWYGDTFHNMWQSYRTRKDRTLALKSDPHKYDEKGEHTVMVKVIDIFGNDTTRILEVKA